MFCFWWTCTRKFNQWRRIFAKWPYQSESYPVHLPTSRKNKNKLVTLNIRLANVEIFWSNPCFQIPNKWTRSSGFIQAVTDILSKLHQNIMFACSLDCATSMQCIVWVLEWFAIKYRDVPGAQFYSPNSRGQTDILYHWVGEIPVDNTKRYAKCTPTQEETEDQSQSKTLCTNKSWE